MHFIVIKPIITEASIIDAKNGKFTFQVEFDANKTQIRKEIQDIYGVTVTGITTINSRSSKVIATKFGRKTVKNKIKKARVKLQKGQTIPAFEIPEEKADKSKKEKKEVKKD